MTVMDRSELDDLLHVIDQHSDVLFTWDYERQPSGAGQVVREGQDLAVERVDGARLVDRGRPGKLAAESAAVERTLQRAADRAGLAAQAVGATRSGCSSPSRCRRSCCRSSCTASRARSICTGLITATVPWIDAKYYAATQVMDEARHVEVFARYIEEKTRGHVPDQREPRPPARRHRRGRPLGHHLPRACRSWSRASRSRPSGSCT